MDLAKRTFEAYEKAVKAGRLGWWKDRGQVLDDELRRWSTLHKKAERAQGVSQKRGRKIGWSPNSFNNIIARKANPVNRESTLLVISNSNFA